MALPQPIANDGGVWAPDNVGAVALGQDDKIHMFSADWGTNTPLSWVLDPSTDTWSAVDTSLGAKRSYFSAVQTPKGDWRFIGGGVDVQGEVHPLDITVFFGL
jgi:hypothetical protein